MNLGNIGKTYGPLLVAFVTTLVEGIQGHLTDWHQPFGPAIVILSLIVSLANVYATWKVTNSTDPEAGWLRYSKLIAGSLGTIAQAILATAASVGGLDHVTASLWLGVLLTAVATFSTWLIPNEPPLVATAEDGTGQQVRLYGALPIPDGGIPAPADPKQPAAGTPPASASA